MLFTWPLAFADQPYGWVAFIEGVLQSKNDKSPVVKSVFPAEPRRQFGQTLDLLIESVKIEPAKKPPDDSGPIETTQDHAVASTVFLHFATLSFLVLSSLKGNLIPNPS